jgi:hypothetical protein
VPRALRAAQRPPSAAASPRTERPADRRERTVEVRLRRRVTSSCIRRGTEDLHGICAAARSARIAGHGRSLTGIPLAASADTKSGSRLQLLSDALRLVLPRGSGSPAPNRNSCRATAWGCRGGAGAPVGSPMRRATTAAATLRGRALTQRARRRSCGREGSHARGPRRQRWSSAGQRRCSGGWRRPPPATGRRTPLA